MPFLTLKETYIPAWKTDNRDTLANLIGTHDLIIKNTFLISHQNTNQHTQE